MKVEKIIAETEELDIVKATLLSLEEAKKLPIRLRQYNKWWWLRSSDPNQSYTVYVFGIGSAFYLGDQVYNEVGAVRPVLKLDGLKSSNFTIGDVFIFSGKRFEVIDNETAFCLEDIGTCAFRKDWRAEDANNYEKSDVKKFIDDWFDQVRKNND